MCGDPDAAGEAPVGAVVFALVGDGVASIVVGVRVEQIIPHQEARPLSVPHFSHIGLLAYCER